MTELWADVQGFPGGAQGACPGAAEVGQELEGSKVRVTKKQRAAVAQVISKGLIRGLGTAKPGELCLEAAICLAMGEAHGDAPSCVAAPDRKFGVRLNDAGWSSPQARAEALLPLGLAQLGTAGTDRGPWVRALVLKTIQRVLPLALERRWPEHAKACREAKTPGEALQAARAAAYGDAHAASYAYAYVDAAYADADAADADAADAYTYAAAAAYAHAASYAERDKVLREAVACALEAYEETKVPGKKRAA